MFTKIYLTKKHVYFDDEVKCALPMDTSNFFILIAILVCY